MDPMRPRRPDIPAVLARLGCSPAEGLALAVLTAGSLAGLALLWLASRPGPASQPTAAGHRHQEGREPVEVVSERAQTVVHVAGEVAEPGLYRLPGGARVADALDAAGGPARRAVLDGLNLARPVADGEQIVVPGPQTPAAPAIPGAAGTAEGAATGATGAPVDLNTATAAQLEALPGIGEVLSQRIVDWRTTNGSFTAVEQLREIEGIGDKTFAALQPLVRV